MLITITIILGVILAIFATALWDARRRISRIRDSELDLGIRLSRDNVRRQRLATVPAHRFTLVRYDRWADIVALKQIDTNSEPIAVTVKRIHINDPDDLERAQRILETLNRNGETRK